MCKLSPHNIVHTFKSGIAEVFSPEALDTLHTIHNNGPPEDVRQDEDVKLLQGGARLGSEADQLGPLLQHLPLGDVVIEESCLPALILLPARVEPESGGRG